MENNVYGYIRVSTKKQSVELQRKAISQYSRIDEWFEDTKTGTTINRDDFNRLVKWVNADLDEGNKVTIIFYSVSRMSRNAREGIELYFDWYNRGVELVFLSEHHIDTASYRQAQNKAIASISTNNEKLDKCINGILECLNEFINSKVQDDIIKAFEQAEKEVQDLHKRTSDGMRASGANEKISKARKGNIFTTAKELNTRISMIECLKDFGGQQSIARFANDRGLSRVTVYKYLSNIKADLQTMSREQAIREYTKLLKAKKPKEQA